MRPFVLAIAVASASASPAPAQDMTWLHRQNELEAEQRAARDRSIAFENEFRAAQGRLATEQAILGLERQRARPDIPDPVVVTPRSTRTARGAIVSIPDDRLAASNARVRAASRNDR